MSDAGDAPTSDRGGRELRVAIGAAVALGLAVTLAVWLRADAPVAVVEGRALGPVERVVLVDAVRAVVREAQVRREGGEVRYRVEVPSSAQEPAVVIHGQGGALIESGRLDATGERIEVRPLAVWRTPVRIRREGTRYRLDWSPIPEGEGFPVVRRYSVLLGYRQTDGERGETTLLSFDPFLEIERQELLDVLKDRDPAATELDLSLRAFDPTEGEGPLWVGTRRTWQLDEGEAAAPGPG